jgi:siroheme synthase-like protein
VAADLGTTDGTARLIAQAPDADILVNNLGIFEVKRFFEIPDEDWERFFRVNVLSGVRLARHYTQGMVQRGWGRVMFISSESGIQIPVEMVHYGMTKSAQLAVSRGLAESVAGTGVTVNAVLPGPTRSEGVEKFLDQFAKQSGKSLEQTEKDFFRNARPSSLIRRFATVDEVANMVVYLASEQASATTGAAVRVVAPKATPRVREWAREGRLEWEAREYRPADLAGMFLVIAATGSAALHQEIYEEARSRGVLCNAVDEPERCDFYFPAVVRRGELQIAISTGGLSPALAQRLRKELEQQFGPEWEEWVAQLGRTREELQSIPMPPEQRKRLLHQYAGLDPKPH